MTAQPTTHATHRLDVPGGTVYYEVRGSGRCCWWSASR